MHALFMLQYTKRDLKASLSQSFSQSASPSHPVNISAGQCAENSIKFHSNYMRSVLCSTEDTLALLTNYTKGYSEGIARSYLISVFYVKICNPHDP